MTKKDDDDIPLLSVDEDVPWELEPTLTPEEEQEVIDWLNEPIPKPKDEENRKNK